MICRLLSASMVLAALGAASAATPPVPDYNFPSPNPPANIKPSLVKQFVAIIFDDNQYSCENGTQYETKPAYSYPASQNYANSGFVGGISPDFTYNPPNPDGYKVGDFGISWASGPLAGVPIPNYVPYNPTEVYLQGKQVSYKSHIWTAKYWTQGAAPDTGSSSAWTDNGVIPPPTLTRKNPDGTPLHFTFNFISGLFIPIWTPGDWTTYQSKYGFWVPKPIDSMAQTKVAVSWGREQMAGTTEGDSSKARPFILHGAQRIIANGHEIGNHTIDHMETNSPLPKSFFDGWGGDGWDATGSDTMPWGEVISEAAQFGQRVGISAQSMGWKYDAGQMISRRAWNGLVKLGEQQLDQYLGVSVAKGNLHAFRAPRLETDAGEFFALKDLHYEYDCGLEEGYSETIDGTNFLWPYTTDNGSVNAYIQKANDEHVYLDSMPSGVWEIPSNCMIVPKALRPTIFSKYHQISAGAGDDWTKTPATVAQDSIEWCSGAGGGKITGFDFNLFILYGLTKDEFIQTMVYNLKQRLAGGKAPLHYGCHTDYYTPIYDNATLQNAFNRYSYGLVVSKGWNTWKDRKAAVEAFMDSAIALGSFVVSGHELIQEIKKLQTQDKLGSPVALTPSWSFEKWTGSPTSSVTAAVGDLAAKVTFVALGDECGFLAKIPLGTLKGLDHVSLTYQSNSPIKVRLVLDGSDLTYDVLLNNCGPTVQSGNIPLSAFQKDTIGYSPLPASAKITGIEIAPQNINKAPAIFSVKSLTFYTGTVTALARSEKRAGALTIGLLTSKGISLNAPAAGTYEIALYSISGKLVQSVKSKAVAGINRIAFPRAVAPAKYAVKITEAGKTRVIAQALVSCQF
jgi:hypothetical protein